MKICVLLSTFNGEKYLDEQIQSILRQKNVDIDILVRDDGSTDETHKILSDWSQKAGLKWSAGENMGWAMSFMNLLVNSPEYDYYAFCDQDDIWQDDKIDTAVKVLESHGDAPGCYFSNLTYWKEGMPLRDVYDKEFKYNKYNCLIQCPAYGCTMVFNKALADIIKSHPPKHVFAHDFWVYQTAVLIGDVYYDPESHILYRQHGNNQEGALKSIGETWKRRMTKSLKRFIAGHQHENNAAELRLCFKEYMNEETLQIVSGIADYRKSFFLYLKLLFSGNYLMQRFENNIWLKLKILFCKL